MPYLKLKKRKVLKTCPGRIYEKLRKKFRDTQRVPFMLDKNRKALFPQLGTKKHFKKLQIFLFQKMSHSAEKCKRGHPLGFINVRSVAKYQKNSKGGSFGDIKIFRKKSRTLPKKN